MRLRRIVLFTLFAGLSAAIGSAADWPRFRGPNGNGTSEDRNVPVTWSEKENILWTAAIPGHGNSSPVVWGDRLYLQSASKDGKDRWLFCIDTAGGKIVWKATAPGHSGKTHNKNTLASSTPAVDGERIYAAFWMATRCNCLPTP